MITEGRYCCVGEFMNYSFSSGNLPLINTILIFSLNLILLIHFIFINFTKTNIKNYKEKIILKLPEIIIIFSQLLYYRIVIDSTDTSHLLNSVIMNSILIIYFYFYYLKTIIEKIKIKKIKSYIFNLPIYLMFFILFFYLIEPINHTLLKTSKFIKNFKSTNDSKLFNNFLDKDNFEKIFKEVDKSECFYTLDNNLSWNFYFNKSYCSKYHYNYINLSSKSQNETINNLKKYKPNIILHNGNNELSNLQYGISTYSMNYLIYEYILNHYKPYLLLNNNWFWIYNNKKINLPKEKIKIVHKIEHVDKIEESIRVKIIRFSGLFKWVENHNISDINLKLSIQDSFKNNYIGTFITVGNDHRPIWSGPISNFNDIDLYIPINSLEIGINDISIYLFNNNNELELLNKLKIDIKNFKNYNYRILLNE